jgi:hypothetical protein
MVQGMVNFGMRQREAEGKIATKRIAFNKDTRKIKRDNLTMKSARKGHTKSLEQKTA